MTNTYIMFFNIIYLTHENHQHSNFLLTTNDTLSNMVTPLGTPFLRTTHLSCDCEEGNIK